MQPRLTLILFVACTWPLAVQARETRGALQAVNSGGCLSDRATPGVVGCEGAPVVELQPLPRGEVLIRQAHKDACLYSNHDGRFSWSGCNPSYEDQRWEIVVPGPEGNATALASGGMMLRSVGSKQCLFSNRDGRFGRYACMPGFEDQYWRLVRVEREPEVANTPPTLVGDWLWADGAKTFMRADGSFVMPNDATGTWRFLGGDAFEVRFGDGPPARVHLSPDGESLSGAWARRDGDHPISAHRLHAQAEPPPANAPPALPAPVDCGTGADDPGCRESRDGRFPMPGDAFQGLMGALQGTDSELSKRDMIKSASATNDFTARQFTTMLAIFRSEVTEMEVVKALASHVVDPQRALGYASQLRSSLDREMYVKLLTAPPPQEVHTEHKPETRCPPQPACGLACHFGMAHDANGCGLCACAPDPMAPSKRR